MHLRRIRHQADTTASPARIDAGAVEPADVHFDGVFPTDTTGGQPLGAHLEHEDKVRVWTYLLARLQQRYLGSAVPWPAPLMRWAATMLLVDLGLDPAEADDLTLVESVFDSVSRGAIAGPAPTPLEVLLRAMMSNWSATELLRDGADPQWGELFFHHPVVSVRCDAVMLGPSQWLVRLARDPSPTVRRLVAARRPVPADAAAVLVADPDAAVRRGLAGDPLCAADLLLRLAADPIGDVAVEVASNPGIPPEVAIAFSRSAMPYVRARLAENPGCPVSVLDQLRRDSVPQVARLAAFTLRQVIERS